MPAYKPIPLGSTFGFWTTLDDARPRVACRCACGTLRHVVASTLRRGLSSSCGCRRDERTRLRNTTHGSTESPEYYIWCGLKGRCLNPRNHKFAEYGGRGITVCERWRNSFEAFLEDMGRRPSPHHSLDRIDNSGHYEPNNCRWATPDQQSNNKRNNRKVFADANLVAAARLHGLQPQTLYHRLKAGWSIERALLTPVRHWPSQSST